MSLSAGLNGYTACTVAPAVSRPPDLAPSGDGGTTFCIIRRTFRKTCRI